jgi:hypothetical protein
LHDIVEDTPPWSDPVQPGYVHLIGQEVDHLYRHLNACGRQSFADRPGSWQPSKTTKTRL